ncbi:hypothetical protein ACFLZV_04190, partial [Candidatus Margulisiibacteriota bacterium]
AKSDSLPVTQNLAIWLDGSEPHGVSTSVSLSDDDSLMTWLDYSGNSRHLRQNDTTKKPTFNTNVLNSKSVLRFDGIDDYLRIEDQDIADYLESGRNVTIFTVFKMVESCDGSLFRLSYGASEQVLIHPAGTGGVTVLDLATESTARLSFTTPTGVVGTSQLWSCLRNEGLIQAYNKSTLMAERTDASSTASWSSPFSVGLNYYGDVAELIIYKGVLSASQILEVEEYLSNKWGMAVNTLVWDGDAPEDETVSAGDNWDTGGKPGSDCKVIFNSTSDWIDWDSSATVTINAIELSGSYTGSLFIMHDLYVSTNITVNAGALVIDGGALTVATINSTGGGSLKIDTGALKVRKVELDLENAGGILEPGLSAGITQISGNYTQGPTATLNMELGGTSQSDPVEYDQLHVSGNIILDGALQVVLIDSFVPTLNDTFDLMDWDGIITGNFSMIKLPTLNSGLAWDLNRLYTDGKISVISLPGSVSGAVLWLSSADRGSLSVSGNNKVRTWIDKSGSDRSVTQTNETYKPEFITNLLNGKPMLRFDGSDDRLSDTNLPLIPTDNSVAIFVVFILKGNPTSQGAIFAQYPDSNDATNHYIMVDNYDGEDPDIHIFVYDQWPPGGGYLVSGTDTIGKEHAYLVSTILDGSDRNLHINGVLMASDSSSIETYGGATPTRFDIGRGAAVTNCLNGDIAELIIYDSDLSNSEREQVEKYLMEKWSQQLTWDNGAGDGKVSSASNWDADITPNAMSTLVFDTGSVAIDWDSAATDRIYKIEVTGNYTGTLFLRNDLEIIATLNIQKSVVDQTTGNVTVNAIIVGSNGAYENKSSGDLVIGSGGVANEGSIVLDSGGIGWGDADSIHIQSKNAPTKVSWIGSGTFTVQDCTVNDQGVAGGATIKCVSSTDGGDNDSNWEFSSAGAPKSKVGVGSPLIF